MEMLLDISSWLYAAEYFIQAREQMEGNNIHDAGAASPNHTKVATEMMIATSRCAAAPLQGDLEVTTAPGGLAITADLSDRVRETVSKTGMKQAPILIVHNIRGRLLLQQRAQVAPAEKTAIEIR